IISKMVNHEEIFWQNSDYQTDSSLPFTIDDIKDAEARLSRFSSYIKTDFPETKENNGKNESQIFSLDTFKNIEFQNLKGQFMIKSVHDLTIAGYNKASGGIYEVL